MTYIDRNKKRSSQGVLVMRHRRLIMYPSHASNRGILKTCLVQL